MSAVCRTVPRATRRLLCGRSGVAFSKLARHPSSLTRLNTIQCRQYVDFDKQRPAREVSQNAAESPKQDAKAVHSDHGNGKAAYLGTVKRLPEFSLTGKVMLVTGAARGLGLVQAEALLEAGAQVYALDRLAEPSDYFPAVQDRASSSLGTTLEYRRIDTRDVQGLNDVIASIADKHGRLDGLVAAAGIQQETPALEYNIQDCNRMLEVNVTGTFMTAQATAKQMIKYKCPGSMALIASMSGSVANRDLLCAPYNSSKAAVVQLGKNLASEWGRYGIRVNTISPGYIETEMTASLFETHPERRTEWANQNMLGRVSMPREFRGSAVFLMSDASSFMTGADLKIDGGHSAW